MVTTVKISGRCNMCLRTFGPARSCGYGHYNGRQERSSMCKYQGYEFGAQYPDSVCIDGQLFDADNCDDEGNLYEPVEFIPCPMCKREDAIKWHAGRFSQGTHKERMKSARLLVADIHKNRRTGNFPLPVLSATDKSEAR